MERFQTLQTLCQIGIALFSVLAILCGYGAYHYNQKKDQLKEAKTSEILMRNDSTKVSETTYHAQGDVVQGDKIVQSKKEEINAPSALIVTKDQSGGQNIVNFSQNEFTPLNDVLKKTVQEKINKLIQTYPDHPTVSIEIESGNSQRHRVAEELESLLSKDNLGVYGKGNTYIGRFPDYPISVFLNPSSAQYAKDLVSSISDFISGEFKIIENPGFPPNFIRMYINGIPVFDPSGKVKIQ